MATIVLVLRRRDLSCKFSIENQPSDQNSAPLIDQALGPITVEMFKAYKSVESSQQMCFLYRIRAWDSRSRARCAFRAQREGWNFVQRRKRIACQNYRVRSHSSWNLSHSLSFLFRLEIRLELGDWSRRSGCTHSIADTSRSRGSMSRWARPYSAAIFLFARCVYFATLWYQKVCDPPWLIPPLSLAFSEVPTTSWLW